MKTTINLFYIVFVGSIAFRCQAFHIVQPVNGPYISPLTSRQRLYDPPKVHQNKMHGISQRKTNLPLFSSQDENIQKLSLEYRAASTSFKIVSLIMMTVHALVTKGGSVVGHFLMSLYYVSGPILAAGICSILPSAVENNRLTSDTYQRLNLFLVYSSLVQLLAGMVDYPNLLKRWIFSATAALLCVIPAWKGWVKGIQSTDDSVGKIGTLWKSGMEILKGMVTFKTTKSFVYLCSVYFVTLLKIQNLLDLKNVVVNGSNNVSYMIATRLFRYSKLSLVFGTLFTLKSAADRDRLEGGTFIRLNYLCSFYFLSMALHYSTSWPVYGVVSSLFFSTFCGVNGLSSSIKNKNKE